MLGGAKARLTLAANIGLKRIWPEESSLFFDFFPRGVQPADLQEVHGVHVPEGHLTVAQHFSGGKTRASFHIQSRKDD